MLSFLVENILIGTTRQHFVLTMFTKVRNIKPKPGGAPNFPVQSLFTAYMWLKPKTFLNFGMRNETILIPSRLITGQWEN